MRYVDIDKPVYVRYIDERSGEAITSEHTIAEILSDAIGLFPVEDVVEVVRCKDCKHHDWCSIEDMALNDETFFCKWGERIE